MGRPRIRRWGREKDRERICKPCHLLLTAEHKADYIVWLLNSVTLLLIYYILFICFRQREKERERA